MALLNNLNIFGCNQFSKLALDAIYTTCFSEKQDRTGLGDSSMAMGFRRPWLVAEQFSCSKFGYTIYKFQNKRLKSLIKEGACHLVKPPWVWIIQLNSIFLIIIQSTLLRTRCVPGTVDNTEWINYLEGIASARTRMQMRTCTRRDVRHGDSMRWLRLL